MGRIGRLIQTAIEKYIVQTVEAYFGANVTAETFAPSGDDSPPLPDDRIVLVQTDGTGNFVAVGVLSVSQGAKPGERILYSRDSDGEVQAAIKLLNDGKVEMIALDELSLSGKSISARADESISAEAKSKVSAKGAVVEIEGSNSVRIKSAETQLTGGAVKCKGTAIPDGTGCFCGVPYCLYSGAPQTGANVNGA